MHGQEAEPARQSAGQARTALITGAGRGIGAAIATALHRDGLRVALLDQDGPAVRATAHSLDSSGRTALAVEADVADTRGLERAMDLVSSAFSPPDVLVNNAARTVAGSLWEISAGEWDTVLAVNLRSVFVLTRLCAPAMRERRWGRVVNLASLAGQQGGTVAGAHYSAAKAGVLVLTKIFARELAPYGVNVNAVAPASVRTPAMDELPGDVVATARGSRRRSGLPGGRGRRLRDRSDHRRQWRRLHAIAGPRRRAGSRTTEKGDHGAVVVQRAGTGRGVPGRNRARTRTAAAMRGPRGTPAAGRQADVGR